MKLRDNLVLVTGASSGIGAEIARAAADRGARLLLVARGREALEKVAAEIRDAAGDATVMPADLANLDDVERLAANVLADAGAPDVLVNNAGAGRWRAIDENEPGEARRQIELPYLAAYELTRALVPAMIKRGSGHIVNMTSLAGFVTIPGASGYGTARWAMRAFSSHLREDLRGTGVDVLLLAPSEVDSPYFAHNPGTRERIPGAAKLAGPAMTPEEVARDAVRAIERGRTGVRIMPARARWVYRTTPPPLMRTLLRWTGWKRPH
ncbi:MAG TPA: SDR family NAD(P)-dependent oxidoreductase [Solirubrobacterales bacterium]